MVPRPAGTVAVQSQNNVVAPVTGTQNLGVARSEIKQGVREVVVCKDAKGKIGLRVRDVSKVNTCTCIGCCKLPQKNIMTYCRSVVCFTFLDLKIRHKN